MCKKDTSRWMKDIGTRFNMCTCAPQVHVHRICPLQDLPCLSLVFMPQLTSFSSTNFFSNLLGSEK
jgi:hypothetical protein